MTETTQACIRGCTMLRRHLSECEGANDDTCRGCLPRRAEHGRLCFSCHRRFELMLTDADGVFRWLTGNLTSGEGQAPAKTGWITGSKGDGPPLPIKAHIFDVRQLLADRLAAWVDDMCEDRGLTGPKTHDVAADAKFLRTWLSTVESFDWIGDWFEELAETMSDAHALAPWRPEVKRCKGVPCPECEEVNLVIFGGESDVTCMSCRTMIPEDRFGLWEQIVAEEKREAS